MKFACLKVLISSGLKFSFKTHSTLNAMSKCNIDTKGHSLYQISSKMLPGSKVITLVEKKRKEVAWLGLELTTSHLEVQCANHYTMETFMMNLYFFKCHYIKVITFKPGNIFELTWYSEWPLVNF